jgi:hypothetical protein
MVHNLVQVLLTMSFMDILVPYYKWHTEQVLQVVSQKTFRDQQALNHNYGNGLFETSSLQETM